VLAVATRLFAERGYEDTSIEAVLREAGISRGSLYHHFASKEALFDPVVQRIMLIDAPSVLGWQRWRKLDERHVLGMIRAAVGVAAESGRVPPEMVDMFAHVILGLVNEVALLIARADDPAADSRSGEAAVDEILRRLLAG
jgi:AcrR family transcriptional regulator